MNEKEITSKLNLSISNNVSATITQEERSTGEEEVFDGYGYNQIVIEGKWTSVPKKKHSKYRVIYYLLFQSDYGKLAINLLSRSRWKIEGSLISPLEEIKNNQPLPSFKNLSTDNPEYRKILRDEFLPIYNVLLKMGFQSNSEVEDFLLLKNTSITFKKINREQEKEKFNEKLRLRLEKDYILFTKDSAKISASDIQSLNHLAKSSNIILSKGTEEIPELGEIIEYYEFIPTSFNDTVRIAFIRCSQENFNEEKKSQNTINRILRLMMPVFEILRNDFDINMDTTISLAKGDIQGPIVINRIRPLSSKCSSNLIQISELSEAIDEPPADMIVVSCKDNIWDLSFNDGKLLQVDSQGKKEHSLNVIKHELLKHGYFIHEPAFDNYMKKADFSKNLYFKKNRNK